jgi:hypothetical protein
MRGFFLVGALLISRVGAAEQPTDGRFATVDGAVVGMLPCRATPLLEPAPLPSMPPVRGFKCSGPTFTAAVQYLDYPPTDVDSKLILDHARDGSVANVREGRLVSEQVGKLAGRPGRDIVVSAKGVTLRERLVIERDQKKTRLYLILFSTVPSQAADPRIQTFFDSIRFKTDQAAVSPPRG